MDIEHLLPSISTVIRNVDLRPDLPDEVIEGIRRVLVARKVTFLKSRR